MGSMKYPPGNFYDRAISINASPAWKVGAEKEVDDFQFIECEPPPDCSHGIVWAHRVTQSPPDIFGELMAWLDHQVTHVKNRKPKNKGRRRRA